MEKLLIIGGVAAGATAAARARRLNSDIEISILEAGSDVSFANCGLPYFLGGEVENRSDLILASPETFKEEYNVTVHLNTEARTIDRKNKTVTAIQNGKKRVFDYDKLILAQGGKPIVPPLPGVDQKNVFTLWTLSDMDKINTFITNKKPKTAVVVGAGFIGLEMVEALVHRGLDVHLVELAPQVMIQLEAEIAGFVTKELLDYGVRLHLNTSLQAIKKDSVLLSDGSKIKADLVLLSVGVRPSLQLAKDAGLAIGEMGGLLVDEYLQTNDEAIFAAGDMNEITNTISQKKQRVPLAGPANRQGRIAAENALGGKKRYKGSAVSSIVKVFKAHAGSTGLSLKQAKEAGFNADAIVVHKSSHTSYYPGAFRVSLMLIFDKTDGRILGAQAAGRVGVDKRLDVIATAIAGKLKLEELGELDLAYAPPFNSPNGPEQMAAFVAENHRIGFSPSILAQNLEDWVLAKSPIIFDIRDPISYSRAHLSQTNNLSQGQIQESLDSLPKDSALLVISEDGQKGHILTRMLLTKGYSNVLNLSGGYISLERQERAKPFEKLRVGLHAIEKKSIQKSSESHEKKASEVNTAVEKTEGPLIIDVRTPMEFKMGAVPGAIHADLDSLEEKIPVITKNDFNREIILYCASGARSSYGVRILKGLGYTNVTNGGGLHTMMSRFA